MFRSPRSGCAINAAVEVLGDQWTIIVLRDIVFGGRRHFRELLSRNDEGIASNILADRLRRLVSSGLLTRDDAARGQKAAYRLTAAAIDTVPIMVALGQWGVRYRETTPELAIRAQLLADSPELTADLMAELREIHLNIPRPDPHKALASTRLTEAYERVRARQRDAGA
ncbi:winged helix-turn-helix transcriptional regulator [Nocardia spumae]|uniref:winged helix-turn-helix transcriptional regulator n=1 Tax=Nocardia spumae TaxID=2887190 RepID=UPI001D13DCEA|nr:helix-turn-helix domain-containing protein [Nocardia spumae]